MVKKLQRHVSRFTRSLPHRFRLLRTAVVPNNMNAIRASERSTHAVAEEDMWNTDYWFDAAAVEVLRWYLSDKPMAFINFSGTQWGHLQWEDPDNPVWSRELEASILQPILDALSIDPESPYDDVDWDVEGSWKQAMEQSRQLFQQKRVARIQFAELASCLVD